MDPRQSLSRTSSSNIQQGSFNPNMASAYAMPPYQNNTLLPPINYSQLPPANSNYMPQQYRSDINRYQPAPSPTQTPDRYSSHMAPPGSLGGLPPASMLPQPHNQAQQPANYTNPQQSTRQNYPQPLAPAPPRPSLETMQSGYGQQDNRQPAWSGTEQMPGMPSDASRDPARTHVVGSQGRRGILPSAPGRPPVVPNGMNGSPKSSAIPAKDADGKFPCPNCTKTYLHAKHLKRHMLRHTGDRPYMCVLCNDTFSRSDILKRHFQKCSVRRGNPTGASHLSNPAAHLKKSQAATAKTVTGSPASATTPSSTGHPNGPFTTTSLPGSSLSSTAANIPAPTSMSYPIPNTGQGDMQRPTPNQPMQGNPASAGMDPNASHSWQMHNVNARNNQMMYHPTSAAPDPFGMVAVKNGDERNQMPGPHHMGGEEWNHMFQPASGEHYMNPMFSGYDHGQSDGKKEFESHEAGSNGYYVPSTSLGADGTLGPPLWNLDASREDPLQAKVDRLVDFCFPPGIQESLQEQQNNLPIRSCLTVDAVKHFLQLFPNMQGHFPCLHMPTFNFIDAYDGLILTMVCTGAVYSDRVSRAPVRGLMQRVRDGVHRNSRIFQRLGPGTGPSRLSASKLESEELVAVLLLHGLFLWHGGPEERASARDCSRHTFQLMRRLNMLNLSSPEQGWTHSYLHHLAPGEQADPARWDWQTWLDQEMRSRLMYLAFLLDCAQNLYFNYPPHFHPSEIKVPLPCDDDAWDARDAETCAQALGLRGPAPQSTSNQSGSLRLKQLEMHHAMSALHSTSVVIQPRTTNVYSKFILIHALHMEIWQLQQKRSYSSPGPSPISGGGSTNPSVAQSYKSIGSALVKWKQSWDEDMQLQYPPSNGVNHLPKRVGFCRDGIQFHWLARAFIKPDRMHDWQLAPDARFRQVLNGLKRAREWSRSDGAQRGEEPGSVYDIHDDYANEPQDHDMRKFFRPLEEVYDSPGRTAAAPN